MGLYRNNQTLPITTAFSSKVKIKYETKKYICVKTNKMDKFNRKWTLPLDSVTNLDWTLYPSNALCELGMYFLFFE